MAFERTSERTSSPVYSRFTARRSSPVATWCRARARRACASAGAQASARARRAHKGPRTSSSKSSGAARFAIRPRRGAQPGARRAPSAYASPGAGRRAGAATVGTQGRGAWESEKRGVVARVYRYTRHTPLDLRALEKAAPAGEEEC